MREYCEPSAGCIPSSGECLKSKDVSVHGGQEPTGFCKVRSALLPLGARLGGQWRTQAPTGSRSRRDPTSTPAASGLPSKGAHAGGEGVGAAGAARNAHPRKHRAPQRVREGCALTRSGVK